MWCRISATNSFQWSEPLCTLFKRPNTRGFLIQDINKIIQYRGHVSQKEKEKNNLY